MSQVKLSREEHAQLVSLSIQLGFDLTPTGDLEDRLNKTGEQTIACLEALDGVKESLRQYEITQLGQQNDTKR